MGYKPQSSDTSEDVDRRMFAAYAAMTPEERLRRASKLSLAVQEIALAGLRQRHPGASERELGLRLVALRIPVDAMLAIFGWAPAP